MEWTLENHPTLQQFGKWLLPYLRDTKVTEVSINDFGEVWIERIGTGYGDRPEPASWATFDWAWMFCRALANLKGTPFPNHPHDFEAKPLLSLILPGGHRLHAILGTSVPSGISLSIRTYRYNPDLAWSDFNVTTPISRRLEAAMATGAKVLVSGAPGSGKTSLLRLLGRAVPSVRRVITVGDIDEPNLLPHRNQTRLMLDRFEQRGAGQLGFGDMIDSVLRLNGNVAVLNELSYDNAVPALRLLNTGVLGGFLTTLHSNSALDALEAWRRNVAMREGNAGSGEVVAFLARTIDIVIHCARTGVDRREVTGIAWRDEERGELDVPWRRLIGNGIP